MRYADDATSHNITSDSPVPLVCGLLAAGVGAAVLVGWILDVGALKSVAPGLVSMKAMTAFALLLAGTALVLLRGTMSARAHRAGRILGAVVASIGLAVCWEYLFGGLGIDELPFADTGRNPGRPSPHTAVALVAIGLALASIDARHRASGLTVVLLVVAWAVVLAAIVGYIYGVDYLRGRSGSTGVAVHALAALALLTAGLTWLRPERGLGALLLAPGSERGRVRALLAAAVLVPLVLGALRLAGEQQGLYGTRFGLSFMTLAMIALLLAVVIVTELRLRTTDLDRRRLAAIVDDSDDAIIGQGLDGTILSWNRGAERMYGYRASEMIGRPDAALTAPAQGDQMACVLARIAANEPVVHLETTRVTKDGAVVEVSLTMSPLRDDHGRVVGASTIARDITERKEAERRYRGLLEAAPDGMVIVDAEGRIALVNERVEQLSGFRREELVGEPVEVLLPVESRGEHAVRREAFTAAPCAREMGRGMDLSLRRKDGRLVPVEISLSPLVTAHGVLVTAAVRDVTTRRRAERALAQSEERFRRSFEDSGVGMALVSVNAHGPGHVLRANAALAAITGFTEAQLATMRPLELIHPDERPALEADLDALMRRGLSVVRDEIRMIAASSDPIWVSLTVSMVRDRDGNGVHAVLQALDISERKNFEGQLQHLVDHDALTGLFNRRRFEAELRREVSVATRYGTCGAVLVLDLDHFKLVNDTLGHAAGDELLTIVAQVLRRRLRDTDIVGRLGGDEFGVILPHASAEQAGALAVGLLGEIREDTHVASALAVRRVTASIGIAPFDERSGRVSAEELLAEADIAMYDAKEAGRNRVAVYDVASARHQRVQARVSWAQRIEDAIDGGRFVMHAQPILPLSDSGAPRYELLLRMLGDDGDLIPPGTFLYIAEQSDLVQRIDRWVVRHACELLAEPRTRGVTFELNLSGKSINDAEMPGFIAATISDYGVDPRRLVFEITETAAIVNIARAKAFAQDLRDVGSTFALDDFGAGFASFYYLKHLSFDYLKIDGEFIRDLTASRTNQLIVRAVVDIARELGKQTIAEFVSGQPTVDMLRRFGVDYAQGFFLGQPAPTSQIDFQEDPAALAGRRRPHWPSERRPTG